MHTSPKLRLSLGQLTAFLPSAVNLQNPTSNIQRRLFHARFVRAGRVLASDGSPALLEILSAEPRLHPILDQALHQSAGLRDIGTRPPRHPPTALL